MECTYLMVSPYFGKEGTTAGDATVEARTVYGLVELFYNSVRNEQLRSSCLCLLSTV